MQETTDLVRVLQGQRNAAMDEAATLASKLLGANRDCDRLRVENGTLQDEVTRLKAEILSHEQSAMPTPKTRGKKSNGAAKEVNA